MVYANEQNDPEDTMDENEIDEEEWRLAEFETERAAAVERIQARLDRIVAERASKRSKYRRDLGGPDYAERAANDREWSGTGAR